MCISALSFSGTRKLSIPLIIMTFILTDGEGEAHGG